MSLINDALKRASRTLKQQPNRPASPAPMQPVVRADDSSMRSLVMVPMLLVGLVAAIGLFLWHWQHPEEPRPTQLATTNLASPRTAPAVKPPAAAPVRRPTPIAPPPVETASVTSQPPAVVPPPAKPQAEPPVAVAVAPQPIVQHAAPPQRDPNRPPPTFPALKIQAIYFRLSRPSAMVTGQTVFVGDTVDGVKVVRIDRQSVTFELDGYPKTIDMFLR